MVTQARLALDAMEGDSENTKISYFHHWINGEGISQIEGKQQNPHQPVRL